MIDQVIPTRPRCAACQRVSPVDFHVPNAIWDEVVHPYFRNSILCLWCFVSRADEKLIEWDQHIVLHPVSLATHLRTTRDVRVPTLSEERARHRWLTEGATVKSTGGEA